MKHNTFLAPLALASLSLSLAFAGTPEPREIEAHRNEIWSLAFSPDGKQVASASKDRTIKVWDAGTGSALHTLQGHGSDVLRIAWSPDGKQIASAGADGSVRLWDADSGQALHTFIKAHGNWVTG